MAKAKSKSKGLTPVPAYRLPKRTAKTVAMAMVQDAPAGPAPPDPLLHIAESLRPLAVSLSDLAFMAGNAVKHPESQVEDIKASLRVFGQVEPLIVNRRPVPSIVIGGNGRLAAMLSLGWTHAAVSYVDLAEPEANALSLALNRTADGREWDKEALDKLLREVSTKNDERLDKMLAELATEVGVVPADAKGQTTEDEPPAIDRAGELQKKWRTESGQLWTIPSKTVPGKTHRLLVGDSTKAEDVERLMAGAKAEMMVTDPPYGVEYDADWRNQAKRPDGTAYGASALGKVSNDDRADWRESWALFHGDIAYVWHAGCRSPEVAESLTVCDFVIRNLIVWAKNSMVIGRGDYHHQHEPCWYVVRKGCPGRRTDDRTQTTLWQIDKPHKSETGHSTQKPVECMARPMRNHEAELIYDPFLGSGTTIVAAEQLGRLCYGVEISAGYIGVCLERLSLLGLEPRLAE